MRTIIAIAVANGRSAWRGVARDSTGCQKRLIRAWPLSTNT